MATERLNDIKKKTFTNTCFCNFLFYFIFQSLQFFSGHPIVEKICQFSQFLSLHCCSKKVFSDAVPKRFVKIGDV